MRTVPLLQLALWTSSASAFFPFTPDWLQEQDATISAREASRNVDGEGASGFSLGLQRKPDLTSTKPAERAAQEAKRLATKYGRSRSAQAETRPDVAKRSNQYQVMEAATPSNDMTAGINQDGADYSYFVTVKLGSKGKSMYMLVDTGAGSSWVMGSSCTDKACTMHNTFGPGDSNTFQTANKDFSISYGSGTVRGTLATDTISLAGVSFTYNFGLASNTSDDFTRFAFDGILGLSMSQGANDNFIKSMGDAKKLDKNMFSIALNRASDGTNTGEIRFGSTNSDKYTGDITYTSVSSSDGDWAIPIDDMAYGGSKAQAGGVKSYIDTGTSFIFGPADLVKKVHSVIPGSESSDGLTYTVPCDSNKPLTLTFSGVDFTISPTDWVSPKDSSGKCTSNVYGHEVVTGAWLLGDTFLKNVYAVFDKDQKRIGFAKLAGASKTSSSSISSKGTASATGTSTTLVTGVSSQQSGKPTMGLGGHETQTTGTTATGDAVKPSETSHSAAPAGGARISTKLCTGMVMAALVAALA
ncbi:hypothetical protein PLIIFM63780_007427 [Purpureocillium lilacinum]|uniref:uncharacterized protein n=1 Tax=Purpureocillium lilacinum TaxID=33203 RepID=UPI00207EE2CF|nr:hypothetical protein PLICBS_007441 [Purpureocillium lilacinum]GJN83876.1 hypothetical protein PLIIFM63780_007427 [Purpureocillium lilacinum]